MLRYALAYLAAFAAMLVLDLLWLGVIAKDKYASALGSLLKDTPNIPAAAAFYLLYIVGILYFAVAPSLGGTWLHAAGRGAALGFFAYMTYEFTNLALIRGWPSSLVAMDIAWGVVLTGVAATAAWFAARAVG